MKDKAISPTDTKETEEQEEFQEDGKERSRGKRRTAREIAQMFEQLKQRHLTRKKEWHAEKQELLKRAGMAEESKHLLVELKKLLKELKGELYLEETKRKNAEEEYEKAKIEWKSEKQRLLKMMANLESRRHGSHNQDRRVPEELEVVKTRLQAREKELAKVEKTNIDILKAKQELKHRFEFEKQSLQENHEGDKRNWEKTRLVMLDKIEKLQEELRKTRTDPFPLHGSHVGSPFDEVLSDLTSSPEMEDYFSCEQKSQIMSPESMRQNISSTSEKALDKTDSISGHYQRTVEQALNEIEKITQDLSNAHPQKLSSTAGKQTFLLSPPTSSSTSDNTHWLSLNNSPLQKDEGSKLRLDEKRQTSLLSKSNQASVSKSPRSSHSGLNQKVKQDNKTIGLMEPCNKSSKTLFKSHSILEKNVEIPEMASPANSTSTSGSCSIPTFTESSAESPQIPAFEPKSDESMKSPNLSLSGETPGQTSFAKIEKNYSSPSVKDKAKDPSGGQPTKRLPSLHQQLLFGNASKQSSFDRDNSREAIPAPHDHKYRDRSPYRATSSDKTSKEKVYRDDLSKQRLESAKKPAHQQHSTRTYAKKQLPQSCHDFVGHSVAFSSSQPDFVPKSRADSVTPATESISAPPVRPKPSVKIEKDNRGNVLRVVSESGITRQESPRRTASFEDSHRRDRRRRTQDVIHDIKPLVCDETIKSTLDLTHNHQIHHEKVEEKESLGSRGKSWIKKRLSFLDNVPKENVNKVPKKRESLTSKTRSSSLRRVENIKLTEMSTSEESDDVRNQFSRRKSGRKDGLEKKGKAKRYTRSKTDSAIDVKNLLAKFKASQFSSKKPTIVKEFEKKLLENEVKTLEDEKGNKAQDTLKKNDSLRRTLKVRDKNLEDDDGYKGEDELDYIMQSRKAKAMTLPSSAALTRSPSIKSLQEQLFGPKDNSIPSFHKSLMDLSSADNYIAEPPAETTFYKSTFKIQSPCRETYHPQKAFSANTQIVATSSDEKTKTIFSPEKNKLQTSALSNTDRASPGCLFLPDSSRLGGRFAKKRLSWATNLQQSMEEECSPPPSPRYHNNPASDRISTSSVTGILLKPKHEQIISSGRQAAHKQHHESEKEASKNKGCNISMEMKKKADKLEKVLNKGAKKPRRRYKRSETQPIALSPSDDESGSEYEPSRGMIKALSMSSETFIKEFHDDLTPRLTSRFKKPILANRRLPSRWKKKDSAS